MAFEGNTEEHARGEVGANVFYNFIVQSVKPWLGPENDNIRERSRLFINVHYGLDTV